MSDTKTYGPDVLARLAEPASIPLLAHRRTDKGSGVVLDLREVGGGFMWALHDANRYPAGSGVSPSIAKAKAAMLEAGKRLGWWGVGDVLP